MVEMLEELDLNQPKKGFRQRGSILLDQLRHDSSEEGEGNIDIEQIKVEDKVNSDDEKKKDIQDLALSKIKRFRKKN